MEAQAAGFVDAEGFDVPASAEQVRAARTATPLPPMPLVVLTHGRAEADGLPPGWPVEAEAALWRELHADLAGLVPDGRLVVAERSGHFIQLDQPELVIGAIAEVVAAVRRPDGRGTPAIGTPVSAGEDSARGGRPAVRGSAPVR